jgi:hypothetical protein
MISPAALRWSARRASAQPTLVRIHGPRGETIHKLFQTSFLGAKRSACVRMSHVPSDADSLIAYQQQLATSAAELWIFDHTASIIGALLDVPSGGVASPGTETRPPLISRCGWVDWGSVESSRKRTPLWAHEIAPGLAIRWPPPTMLATDAEWWGSL